MSLTVAHTGTAGDDFPKRTSVKASYEHEPMRGRKSKWFSAQCLVARGRCSLTVVPKQHSSRHQKLV